MSSQKKKVPMLEILEWDAKETRTNANISKTGCSQFKNASELSISHQINT